MMYFPLTLIIMNHSCWGLDILLINVQELGILIEKDGTTGTLPQRKLIKDKFRAVIKAHCNVLKWQADVQRFMKFNFLAGFFLLSTIFCMSIYI